MVNMVSTNSNIPADLEKSEVMKMLAEELIKGILKKSEAGTLFQQCLPRWK